MKIEPLKLCWIELGEGKVCERLAGHDGECSPDPSVDFPVSTAVHERPPSEELEGLADFIGAAEMATWTCPHCRQTSWNPNDVKYHYCGACHHYCDEVDWP